MITGSSGAQDESYAAFYAPEGDVVKSEGNALWLAAPTPIGEAVRALKHSEDVVLHADLEGVVLRFGTFYGPNTWYAKDGEIGRQMRKRQFPRIGSGEGMTSFIHIADAAAACCAFVRRGTPGAYNIVDDGPATATQWIPVFADAIGARAPLRVPTWLVKLIAGDGIVAWATTSRGASNAAVKRELGWRPSYPSWRQDFTGGLA